MTWTDWLLLMTGMGVAFILWDLIVSGGKRCARLGDHAQRHARRTTATREADRAKRERDFDTAHGSAAP
jgi:hypothetical protein